MDFDFDEYVAACAAYRGEDPPLLWIELAELLLPRRQRGWRFETEDGEPFWAFGLGGAALLVADIHPERPRFHLFEAGADSDRYFDEAEQLAAVLESREQANRGLTRLQKDCIEDGIGSRDDLRMLQHELARQDEAMGAPSPLAG